MRTSGQSLQDAIDQGLDNGDILIEHANLPTVTDRAVQCLSEQSSGVYQRGDVVVGFVGDEELAECDPPFRLVVQNDDALAQRVNRVKNTWKINLRTGKYEKCNFPPRIAKTILAEKRYVFSQLLAIVETPLVLPDGTYLDALGYDRARSLLFHFSRGDFPEGEIAQFVTDEELGSACDSLGRLIEGFPFVDSVSRCVAVAALMTAVLRPAMDVAPGFAISARAPGSGKTHLQRLLPLLANGREGGLNPWPSDETEFKKLALALLIAGEPVFSIDNLNGVVRSDTLCVLITSPKYQDRMLGVNQTVSVPVRTTVAINGNNLTLAGDLVRRFLVCHLDAGIERPEKRRFGFDPVELVKTDRARFVKAILTIAKAAADRGAVEQTLSTVTAFAGFPEWSRLVRAPLIFAGFGDPVASIEASAELDPDRQQLEAMAAAVFAQVGGAQWEAQALVSTAKAADLVESDDQRTKRMALLQAIRDIAERGHDISNKALGHWLRRNEGRIVSGLRFVRRKEKGEAGVRWAVEQVAQ